MYGTSQNISMVDMFITTLGDTVNDPSQRRLTSALHSIILVALVLAGIGAAAILAGPTGLDWIGDAPAISGDAVVVDNLDDLDVSAQLADTLAASASDSATTGDAIDILAPVGVHFEIDDPSTASRIVWVAAMLIDPIVGVLGLWLALGIVRSARTGQPFTEANERRLWSLASVVAIGGTLASMADDFARTFVLQRSDLADLFAIEFTISFLPILAGLAVAVLAGVWRIGVNMSDDLTGTI